MLHMQTGDAPCKSIRPAFADQEQPWTDSEGYNLPPNEPADSEGYNIPLKEPADSHVILNFPEQVTFSVFFEFLSRAG